MTPILSIIQFLKDLASVCWLLLELARQQVIRCWLRLLLRAAALKKQSMEARLERAEAKIDRYLMDEITPPRRWITRHLKD